MFVQFAVIVAVALLFLALLAVGLLFVRQRKLEQSIKQLRARGGLTESNVNDIVEAAIARHQQSAPSVDPSVVRSIQHDIGVLDARTRETANVARQAVLVAQQQQQILNQQHQQQGATASSSATRPAHFPSSVVAPAADPNNNNNTSRLSSDSADGPIVIRREDEGDAQEDAPRGAGDDDEDDTVGPLPPSVPGDQQPGILRPPVQSPPTPAFEQSPATRRRGGRAAPSI